MGKYFSFVRLEENISYLLVEENTKVFCFLVKSPQEDRE